MENFPRELELKKKKQVEIAELLTNHYVQIVCQPYARCFTHTVLLNHLKNHRRYILLSLHGGDKSY